MLCTISLAVFMFYARITDGTEVIREILAWIIHEQTLILKKAVNLGALARGYLRLSTHCHS